MLIFKCTQKAAKELGLRGLGSIPEEESTAVLGAWYVNLLRLGHTKTLLCTNETTLYSILIPYLKKDLADLSGLFARHLAPCLRAEGVIQPTIDLLLAEYQTVQFGKTDSRHVLGCMNDLAYMFENHVAAMGGPNMVSWPLVAREINHLIQLKRKDYPYRMMIVTLEQWRRGVE